MSNGELLIVDYMILDLLMKPFNILWISQVVMSADKDDYWEADVLQIVLRRRWLIVLVHVAIGTVVKALELVRLGLHKLTVVLRAINSSISWHL